mmetsp:Transcript_40130/g.103890  ORF Transcript_40130/g.103890 Transcript_40130/m.103890 type:complete len:226 (-) Transcript_40130:863-1540(-)
MRSLEHSSVGDFRNATPAANASGPSLRNSLGIHTMQWHLESQGIQRMICCSVSQKGRRVACTQRWPLCQSVRCLMNRVYYPCCILSPAWSDWVFHWLCERHQRSGSILVKAARLFPALRHRSTVRGGCCCKLCKEHSARDPQAILHYKGPPSRTAAEGQQGPLLQRVLRQVPDSHQANQQEPPWVQQHITGCGLCGLRGHLSEEEGPQHQGGAHARLPASKQEGV